MPNNTPTLNEEISDLLTQTILSEYSQRYPKLVLAIQKAIELGEKPKNITNYLYLRYGNSFTISAINTLAHHFYSLKKAKKG